MTLLIVFLSLTNLALGYGLAIYLGHATPFWQEPATGGSAGSRNMPAVRKTDRTPSAEPSPARTSAAPELSTEAVDAPAAEEVSLADSIKELEAFSGQVQEQASSPADEESPVEEPEAVDQADHDELLKSIGDFQEQLKQQQELSKLPT